jgi:hypothetical protein
VPLETIEALLGHKDPKMPSVTSIFPLHLLKML